MSVRVGFFLIVLALASTAPAQERKPQLAPLTERVEVRVVNVDVTVMDREGRPVTDLQREDFEIFEDGKGQDVTGFYAIQNDVVKEALSGAVPTPSQEQFRKKIVLMIDNNTMAKPPRDAAIEFVGNFVDNHFAGGNEWSVIAIGPEVETLQPFTDDKEAIRAALLQARRKPTYLLQHEIDRDIISDPARRSLREREEGVSGSSSFSQTVKFSSREQTVRNLLAIKNSARAIIQTCRAYSASAGKKALVLVTGGMEINTTFGAWDDNKDRQVVDMKRDIERVLDTMVKEANAANFKIYVIKAGGHSNKVPQHDVANRGAGTGGTMKNPFFGEGFTAVSDTSDVDSSSLSLALQTGGRYMPSADVTDSLERIHEQTSNFYSLAYSPKSSEDGKYHRIEVRVKRPGVEIQHRQGYVALTDEQLLERSLRSPLRFAKEKGTLPVSIALGAPTERRRDKPIIPITAVMPVRSVTMFSRGNQYVGRVHVYLSVYNGEGDNIGFHHQVQDLQVASSQFLESQSLPFRYTLKIPLARGVYTVVMTLRDEISGEFGTAFQDVRL